MEFGSICNKADGALVEDAGKVPVQEMKGGDRYVPPIKDWKSLDLLGLMRGALA